jgi:hypothetical protein
MWAMRGTGFDPADDDIGLDVLRTMTDDWGVEGGGKGAWFEIGVSSNSSGSSVA